MNKLVTLAYKLPAELKADAEVMAALKGASLSEYVRNLVYSDCKKNADKIAKYRELTATIKDATETE